MIKIYFLMDEEIYFRIIIFNYPKFKVNDLKFYSPWLINKINGPTYYQNNYSLLNF